MLPMERARLGCTDLEIGRLGFGAARIDAPRQEQVAELLHRALDLSAHFHVLPAASRAGLGLIAKRPIANARLLESDGPHDDDGDDGLASDQ